MNSRRPLLVGYVILAMMLSLLWIAQSLHRVDLWLLDHELRWLREWRVTPPTQEVALIGIDEATVRQYPEPLAMWHPHLADLLRALAALQPAAVGLDFVLPERSYDSLAPGADRELIRAILEAKSHYPLVLGVTVDSNRHARPLLPAIEAALGADRTGLILWPLDADNRVRRFDERLAEDGTTVPTLSGQLARTLGRDPGRGIVDYSVGPPLEYIPMHTLLDSWHAGDVGAFATTLSGKVVLVGPLFDFEDRGVQPVNLASWEPGRHEQPSVLLHAQALRSILGPGLIREAPPPLSLALAAIMALSWFVSFQPVRGAVLVAGSAVLLLVLGLVFLDHGVHVELALPLFAVAAATGSRAAYHGALTLAERRRLRAAVAGYVSPQVSADLLAGKLDGGFEGRQYYVCVMFVDMRNFTPRVERSRPEQVIRLINECFEEMVAAVHGAGGTVMQFMGDGMMALFGAPNALTDPSGAALAATREIFVRMEQINLSLIKRGVEPVRFGVGLNAGDVLVGHVGARSRFGYGVVGDCVNVAARLEGLAKELGYPMVCGESVAKDARAEFGLTPIGQRAIKGHSPVMVYGWRPKQAQKEV